MELGWREFAIGTAVLAMWMYSKRDFSPEIRGLARVYGALGGGILVEALTFGVFYALNNWPFPLNVIAGLVGLPLAFLHLWASLVVLWIMVGLLVLGVAVAVAATTNRRVGLTLLGLALAIAMLALLFSLREQLLAVVLILWPVVAVLFPLVLFTVWPVLPCMLLGHKEDEVARDVWVEGAPGVFVSLRCRRCRISRYVRQEEYSTRQARGK